MLDRISSHLADNVRRLREARSLTQQELARVSGVPRPTIANLESGSANPTLSVLVRIAGGLGVSIEELIGAPRAVARLYPAGALPSRRRGGASARRLLPDSVPGIGIDRLEIAAGAKLTGDPHPQGAREYLACESGRIDLFFSGEVWRLGPGDVLAFRSDERHAYSNRGRRAAVAYSMVLPAPVGS